MVSQNVGYNARTMPMKVTVCFDKVKVLVPCGDGELLVRELIEKAIIRYKKAQGKSSDYWVSVHTLRTVNEDSILDPDDTLCDVVDDREQLVADFEEQGGPRSHHNGGDGQSVSSAGTASPEIFSADSLGNKLSAGTASPEIFVGTKHVHQRGLSLDSNHDVIVTDIDINTGSGLTVRRGSEPSLHVLDDADNNACRARPPSSKSTGNLLQKNKDEGISGKDEGHRPVIKGQGQREREKTPPFTRFARDSWRQSLGNQPNMFRWLEAQERQEDRIKQTERQGPIGSATSPEHDSAKLSTPAGPVKKEVGILICLDNNGTPLGIHVVPDFNEAGRESGLMVQGIETGGRIEQDGRLKVHDRIIEINGHDLHDVTFSKAQEIFRNAMKTEEVKLKVVKHAVPPMPKKLPPAVLPKPRGHSPTKPSPLTLAPPSYDLSSPDASPADTSTPLDKNWEQTSHSQSKSLVSSSAKNSEPMKTSFPLKALSPVGNGGKRPPPPAPPMRHPSTTLTSGGDNGESFSENGVDGSGPNQSNSDGLKNGGLKSNGEPSSENKVKSVTPTVTPTGTLTKNREKIIAPTNTKKIGKKILIELVKAKEGLGFSVTTRDNPTGGPSPIYIKNILPKGAAVSDGRLKAGDRLLEVNHVEMTGKNQGEAVSLLRNTLLGSTVEIVVSRQEDEDDEEQEEEQDERFKMPRPLHDSNLSDLDQHLHDLDLQSHHDGDDLFQPPEKSGNEDTEAVAKNKELLEFNIPLNDTGSAGLGVSVKGKTLTTEEGTRDLGIFVKAVINGGAASKDGRLQVNDQLLQVNAFPLLDRSNTEAMDLLRNAMQLDGAIPGTINIRVARRVGAPSPSPFTSPGGEEVEWGVSSGKELNNNDSLDNGDHVTDFGRRSPSKAANGDLFSNFKTPNHFLDRVMQGNGLRNESYTRATHDSYVEEPEPVVKRNLIDLSKQRPRPHSTLGIERSSPTSSASSEEGNPEPAWLKGPDWTRHPSQTSDDSGLTPVADGFSRDGFGRQSMSEKRKGHMDPRSSEIYQKVRGLKDLNKGLKGLHQKGASFDAGLQSSIQKSGSYRRLVRAGSVESLLSRSNSNINTPRHAVHEKFASSNIRGPGPPSNLKRFSSLENLSTMPAENDASISASFEDEDDDDTNALPRMARRRGGNESFRAAVDRSYDPVPRLDMDPAESTEDTGSSRHLRRTRSVEEEGSDGADPIVPTGRSEVAEEGEGKKKGKKNKDNRKSGGLLKGFFKFGGHKGRKTPVEEVNKGPRQETPRPPEPHNMGHSAPVIMGRNRMEGESHDHFRHVEAEQEKWRQAQMEHDRAQDQYRRLQDVGRQAYSPFPYNMPPPESHNMGLSAPVTSDLHRDDTPLSRAEKIQQLRADHQRRHMERHGQYPHEDQEEEYERIIQEQEKQKFGHSAIPSQNEPPGQRSRPSSRNQAERPNSRLGSAETNHHGNYQEYRDLGGQSSARHVSDSNVAKYSNFYRPPSRGTSTSSMDPNLYHHPPPNNQFYANNFGSNRGPTPSYDRPPPPQPQGPQRGPTPVHDPDHRTAHFRNNAGNYQVIQRGTPTNFSSGDRQNYSEDSDMRHGNGNVVHSNNYAHRHEARVHPMAPGNFSNAGMAYREPVFTSVAGKRPVKSLTQQPNSAKV
ncbi:partitioning defective 3 homolog isoform X4 [Mya arenaria]|uniref:partitioning defective 3 homolog isoform X4 n=1 Tax=Mya arenaria TaxID=6604 RepID=UPI0022E0FF44|nr:partitioning defective 3 homolog isoform X4 [Mya arenaria]